MLPEDRRNQLDGIVQQMVLNGENDSSIQFVVDEFKKKYSTSAPKKSVTEKVAGALDTVFGGGKIGEAIGTGIAKLTASPEERQFIEKGPSLKELAGDTAGVALTVGTLGGAGLAGKLGARVAKTAALGAGFGAAEAAKEGGDMSASTIAGGAIGAGLPVVGKGLSLTGKAITQALPKSLMQSAIGQSKNALLAGKDVSEYALKQVRFGTADQLIKKSQSSIEQLNSAIQKNLTTGTAPTTRILKNELISEVTSKINAEGGAITAKDVNKIINQLAPQARGLLEKKSLSLVEANRLRSLLDKTLGDRAFLTNQLPFNKDVLKSFANVARERVKTLAPEGTRGLFSELSKEITLRDALSAKYAGKARNEVINAFDVMIAGGGLLGAGPAGAVAAYGIKKGVQSAAGKTGTAVALNKLEGLEPILQKLTPAERTLLLEVLAGSRTSEEGTQSQPEATPQ